eukprot:CAMPEP_0184738304 /NCGR_PEP_ID=MMETSP0315-20130426/988_1 /TAXON_ID=101924 /ORGANISM="Rhodosorus marinus, Strain UTEX LB 2760" /LENGTH=484 /DNA_ID=CAMNT_0027205959 /DNA_START=27 /DNA_END=1481 /DNA_ORIENTATION=+
MMNEMQVFNVLVGLLFAVSILYVVIAPFTKVEESFNVQATHDILAFGLDIGKYDHLQFPGVVPRTFIGPIVLALFAVPLQFLRAADGSRFPLLLITRSELAFLTVTSITKLLSSFRSVFSSTDACFAALCFLSQFHLLFYSSRPLPNVFALVLTNVANALRINSPESSVSMFILCVAAAIFRCEIGILVLTTLVADSFVFPKTLPKRILLGFLGGVLGALASFQTDSAFWTRPCYPELEVFHFNVILNKSTEWGVSPAHWYFTSAIPRALLGSLPLAVYGLALDRRLARIVYPNLAFVLIYSYLPHKELRFIFYALPVLSLCAGVGLSSLFKNRSKSKLRYLAFLCGCGFLLASLLVTTFALHASRLNYPGGHALRTMHELEARAERVNVLGSDKAHRFVHIDVNAAMTGVSRFLEDPAAWTYSKEEDHTTFNWTDFSHLVTARPYVEGFNRIHVEYGFSKSSLRALSVKTEPKVFVHVREDLL